jgi:hypothetical protein
VLYRRGGLSHALSHRLSHGLSHDSRARGSRRKFSEADKRQILEQAILPDACFAEVARRYGIAERVLFPLEAGGDTGSRADVRRGRAYRRDLAGR